MWNAYWQGAHATSPFSPLPKPEDGWLRGRPLPVLGTLHSDESSHCLCDSPRERRKRGQVAPPLLGRVIRAPLLSSVPALCSLPACMYASCPPICSIQ